MAKVDPRNFLLNTDYEMDKIIYYKELTRTASSSTIISIQHDLKTIPMVFGVWSNDPNFSNTHELGETTDITIQSGTKYYHAPCGADADYTNIYIDLDPYQGETTFYIRIFGLEPHYREGDSINFYGKKLPPTNKYAKKFILNTDYNYLKLLKAGRFLEWDSQNGCNVYTHGLGYVPQVLEWASFGGTTEQNFYPFRMTGGFARNTAPSTFGVFGGIFVNKTQIMSYTGIIPKQSEVRLYCDEA